METIRHGLPNFKVDPFQWSKSQVEYYEVDAPEDPQAPLAARRLVTTYHGAANAASRVGEVQLTDIFRAMSIDQIMVLDGRDPSIALGKASS